MQAHKHTMQVFAFFLCFLLGSAQAGTPDDAWYQTEVPVTGYTQEAWEKALAPALQKVLARMTTHPHMTEIAAIRTALSKPSTTVQTFTYRTHPNPAGQSTLFLQIHFSPAAVDHLLRTIDQSPTPEENTETLQATANPPPSAEPAMENAATQPLTPQVVHLVVSGIENLTDYTALMEYLRHMQGVKEVNGKQTQGDRIVLRVTLQGDITRLSQQIEAGDKLEREPIADTTALLSYRWVTQAPPMNTETPMTTALLSEGAEIAAVPPEVSPVRVEEVGSQP
jgi:hypothetical protein